ncbi:MAG: hypothetical protein AAGF30_07720 [Pseudomonadota bacterium]
MRAILILPFLALPAFAQESDIESDGSSLMEQGLKLFMDGFMQEMEPALRDLGNLAEEARPLLESLQAQLGEAIGDLNAYHAPEILPNGDIIIRRKEPLPDGVIENPDGSIDL